MTQPFKTSSQRRAMLSTSSAMPVPAPTTPAEHTLPPRFSVTGILDEQEREISRSYDVCVTKLFTRIPKSMRG